MKPKKYHVILADNHPIKWSNALYYNVFSSLGLPTTETGCGRALHYYLFVGQTKRIAVSFPQAKIDPSEICPKPIFLEELGEKIAAYIFLHNSKGHLVM